MVSDWEALPEERPETEVPQKERPARLEGMRGEVAARLVEQPGPGAFDAPGMMGDFDST